MFRLNPYPTTAAAALSALALALVGPPEATAQDGASKVEPVKAEVTIFQVPGYQQAAFESVVKKFVEAAKKADMGSEFAWWTSEGDGSSYTLVSPVKSMARFDDPEAFIKKMTGTPGEAIVKEAMAEAGKLSYRSTSFVAMSVPEWSYEPEAAPSEMSMTRVLVAKVRPDMEEALGKNLKEWKKAWAKVGAPYPMTAYRDLIGEGGRVHFVFSVDDLDSYYGGNDMSRLFGQAGMTDEYERLVADFLNCVKDYEWRTDSYRSDLSYAPEGA